MACQRQNHYLNQWWNIVNWALRNKLQWNLNRNSYIFIQENAFENVSSKMVAILSWPQCVNLIEDGLSSLTYVPWNISLLGWCLCLDRAHHDTLFYFYIMWLILNQACLCGRPRPQSRDIVIPPASTKLIGGYTGITLSVCPSVRLWTESCPLCIFNNTHRIHFIFAHLIKQLQKVCRV